MRGGAVRRKLSGLTGSVKATLRDWEVSSTRLRRDLADRSGIRAPDVPAVKIGRYALPPAALLLILGFLLAVLGLVAAKSSLRGGSN